MPVAAEAARSPSPGSGARAAASALPRDPAARLQALEPLRRQVVAGLAGLDWRIAHCDVAELDHATLFVTLETLDGAVRIVDARVGALPTPEGDRYFERNPALDEELARCLRGALAGNVISAPGATPGRRWEMPHAPGSAG
jgi:hypothetical protein